LASSTTGNALIRRASNISATFLTEVSERTVTTFVTMMSAAFIVFSCRAKSTLRAIRQRAHSEPQRKD
jgi:hypothetical protein